MENQVDNVVENLRDAMEGMTVRVAVAVEPTAKDLSKIGAVVALGSLVGTAGTLLFHGWNQRRKYKKTLEEIDKGLEDL